MKHLNSLLLVLVLLVLVDTGASRHRFSCVPALGETLSVEPNRWSYEFGTEPSTNQSDWSRVAPLASGLVHNSGYYAMAERIGYLSGIVYERYLYDAPQCTMIIRQEKPL